MLFSKVRVHSYRTHEITWNLSDVHIFFIYPTISKIYSLTFSFIVFSLRRMNLSRLNVSIPKRVENIFNRSTIHSKPVEIVKGHTRIFFSRGKYSIFLGHLIDDEDNILSENNPLIVSSDVVSRDTVSSVSPVPSPSVFCPAHVETETEASTSNQCRVFRRILHFYMAALVSCRS